MRGGVGRFSPPSPRPRRAAACLRCLERKRSARDRASPTTPLWSLHTHSVQHARHSSVVVTSRELHCTGTGARCDFCVCGKPKLSKHTAPGTARGVAPRVEQHGCWENEDMTHKKAANAQSSCPLRFRLSSLPLSLATRRALVISWRGAGRSRSGLCRNRTQRATAAETGGHP